jgi:hypothetical protein
MSLLSQPVATVWRRWRIAAFGLSGLLICASWVAADIASIPAHDAVDWEARGETALYAHRWTDAEMDFRRVLAIESHSGRARRGLACLLWARAEHSIAAVQLVLGMQDGLPLSFVASCGPLGSFANRFSRHVAGATTVFIAPRPYAIDPAEDNALEALQTGPASTEERSADAHRLMAAACLSWRAGYRGLGYQYAELAGATYHAGWDELRYFLTCIGSVQAGAIRCATVASQLPECAFRPDVAREIRRDERLGHI